MSQGTFIFETSLADWLNVMPDPPVIETWTYLSDIIVAWDSTEQRISARRQPRRTIEYNILLEDDESRQREYDRWYQRLSMGIVIPFFQYSTYITQDSPVSTSTVHFVAARSDFRDDDMAVVYRPSTDESFLITLDTISATSSTTANPLTQDIYEGDLISPAFDCLLVNKSGPEMSSVSGILAVKARVTNFRTSFDRPGSTASITEFDSLKVLEKLPLARSSAQEFFDIRPTYHDNQTGIISQDTSWLHAMIEGSRQFVIKRKTDPDEMDYWRDFIVHLRGQREPFLMSTLREDLFLDSNPNPGDSQISIQGSTYATEYFTHDTYTRLALTNPSGEVNYRKVTAAVPQAGGTTLLTLATAVTNDPSWANGFEIAFLNKLRLGSDEIRLTHFTTYTLVDLVIRTTDQ